jgi:hypothetical protein
MASFRMATLGLASLLLMGCASHAELGSDISSPDANDFVSGPDMHRQDEQAHLFRVAGAVRHPGKFSLGAGQTVTLAQALQLAGGPNTRTTYNNVASLQTIRITRLQNGSITATNVDARPGHDGQNFVIKPGDEVFVPELTFDY